jgi:hypothetical protein
MKIELLRQREPFDRVFKDTVEPALSVLAARPVELSWRRRPLVPSREHWICNNKLNAIYSLAAAPVVRRAVRAHYGYHRRWSRELLQRAYVAVASRRGGELAAADGWLTIEPAPERTPYLLFRGGGRRLRMMDYRERVVWVLPKPGLDPADTARELDVRERLPADLPAPAILERGRGESGWFCEELAAGVPLDQVPAGEPRDRAFAEVAWHLGQLIDRTRREVGLADHVARLRRRLEARLSWFRTPPPLATAAAAVLDRVAEMAAGAADSVELTLAHGDVTGDNVLCDRGRISITDWELAGERHIGYTALDAAVEGNRTRGLAGRLLAFVAGGVRRGESPAGALVTGPLAALPLDRPGWRRLAALLFVADKLELQATTALSPHLPGPGPELRWFLAEVARALPALAKEPR